MKRFQLLLCALALAAPLRSDAQEAGDVEASDYSDYFGDSSGEGAEGPHSLGEARKQGRAYRIGQQGSVYRRPARDIHTVHEGDTLWEISERYFGDPWHWPELWSYNPEITNPHWIYPLDQVRLAAGAAEPEQLAAASVTTSADKKPGEFREPKQGLATDLAPRVTVPGKLLQGDTVFLRDEAYLDDDDIKESGKILAASEEQMLLSNSDMLYVRFNKGANVSVGSSYTVYLPISEWNREVGETGRLVRIQGTLLINSFDPQKSVARAVVTETIDPIERGMPVTLMDRRFILERPKPNQANVVARIIGSAQPRRLLAYGNVVFLDAGNHKGIVPGNRFFVIRRGDSWQDALTRSTKQMGNLLAVPKYDKNDLPKEVVAEMRVLKVREKVVIAVITRSDTDVFQGDTVEMRVGY